MQPGGSSLQDREVYSPESLRAEYLRRAAPDAHRQELEAGYLKGMVEEAPAVITLNMRAAATAMNEFLARAYPFRLDANARYARTQFSLAACEEDYVAESDFPRSEQPWFGRGASEPLLGLPMLKAPQAGEGVVKLARWWRDAWARFGPRRGLVVVAGDSLPKRLPQPRPSFWRVRTKKTGCVGMRCPCGCGEYDRTPSDQGGQAAVGHRRECEGSADPVPFGVAQDWLPIALLAAARAGRVVRLIGFSGQLSTAVLDQL